MLTVMEPPILQTDSLCGSLVVQDLRGNAPAPVRGITHDSRQVRKDFVYAAIKGENVDGLEFVSDARRRGASAILTDSESLPGWPDCAVIQVENVRLAMAEMCCRFHADPSHHLKVTGITGTNGKTTISYLCRQMLEAAGKKTGVIGTVAYEIGARSIPASRTTPEAPMLQDLLSQMVRAGCESAVMEVSSHALAQYRVQGTHFHTAVFSNLTSEHLDYHHTMEAYFDAKARLFTSVDAAHIAIVNIDDEWGRKLAASPIRGKLLTYGTSEGADIQAADVQLTADGSRFVLNTPWGSSPVRLPSLGRFNILNVLAAAGAASVQDVDFSRVCESIETMRAAPGRLEEVPSGQDWKVFVDYAHTPDAVEKVLTTLKEICEGRLVIVFGCGGDRDASKRPMMGEAAARLADRIILTSDNPRSEDPHAIIAEIKAGCESHPEVKVIEDRESAIKEAIEGAASKDIILVAGKGHETCQELSHQTLDFDDRLIVRRHLP